MLSGMKAIAHQTQGGAATVKDMHPTRIAVCLRHYGNQSQKARRITTRAVKHKVVPRTGSSLREGFQLYTVA